MIDYILHIGGRGGSGKSVLVDALNATLWLERTKTNTTRKPRFQNEPWYWFLDEAEFLNKFRSNEIIECYFRKSNQSFYWMSAPKETGIYQTEIMGLVALRKWCFQNNIRFLSIYLDISTETLLERLTRRWDVNETPESRLAEDGYYEEFKPWSDIVYDYNGKTVEEGMSAIISIMKERGLIKTSV